MLFGTKRFQNRDFRLRIDLEKPGVLKGAKIRCDWNLKRLLKHHEYILVQVTQRFMFVHDLVDLTSFSSMLFMDIIF